MQKHVMVSTDSDTSKSIKACHKLIMQYVAL